MPPFARVLVVDDHDGLRMQMRQILSMQTGVVAEDAWSGRAALDLIRDNAYDAITLDINMPGMNGFEVIDEIEKSRPELLRRIVVITAYANTARERLDGRVAIMPKPFNATELIEAVSQRIAGDAGTASTPAV